MQYKCYFPEVENNNCKIISLELKLKQNESDYFSKMINNFR